MRTTVREKYETLKPKRSKRELSNTYLLVKFGFDTADNEPCKVCPIPRGAAAQPRLRRTRRGKKLHVCGVQQRGVREVRSEERLRRHPARQAIYFAI